MASPKCWLTTHYLDEAEKLADRVAILREGAIQVCGPVRQVARLARIPTTIKFRYPERIDPTVIRPPVSA